MKLSAAGVLGVSSLVASARDILDDLDVIVERSRVRFRHVGRDVWTIDRRQLAGRPVLSVMRRPGSLDVDIHGARATHAAAELCDSGPVPKPYEPQLAGDRIRQLMALRSARRKKM
jgi:hypothetical protein